MYSRLTFLRLSCARTAVGFARSRHDYHLCTLGDQASGNRSSSRDCTPVAARESHAGDTDGLAGIALAHGVLAALGNRGTRALLPDHLGIRGDLLPGDHCGSQGAQVGSRSLDDDLLGSHCLGDHLGSHGFACQSCCCGKAFGRLSVASVPGSFSRSYWRGEAVREEGQASAALPLASSRSAESHRRWRCGDQSCE